MNDQILTFLLLAGLGVAGGVGIALMSRGGSEEEEEAVVLNADVGIAGVS